MPGRAVSGPGSVQGTKQSTRAVPKDLNADANEKKRRKPQDYTHAAFADDGGEAIGETVANIDAQCYQRRTNHGGENRWGDRAQPMRSGVAERNGHGNGARSKHRRQEDREKGRREKRV